MKFPTPVAGLLALALALSSCSTSESGLGALASNHPNGTGPFDSRGNYIEDWADNPTKWERPTTVPVSTPSRLIEPEDPPIIARNEQPPMHAIPIATTISAVRPAPAPKPAVVAAAKPAPKPVQTAAKPKPKPKPKPAAAAPKKPATVRYTVRSGDSLSRIATRHGTTVSALQKANNINGSLIHPGKVLVIPK